MIDGAVYAALRQAPDRDPSDVYAVADFLYRNAPETCYGDALSFMHARSSREDWVSHGGLRGLSYYDDIDPEKVHYMRQAAGAYKAF